NLFQCMCGNNMSVPLLAEAVTVSGTEKETAAVGGAAVEEVPSFRYLGVHISNDLTWSANTSCLAREAHP
ncbi:hypothetical protein GOODEAATRI_029267, partial [Goodea atripinnis]